MFFTIFDYPQEVEKATFQQVMSLVVKKHYLKVNSSFSFK